MANAIDKAIRAQGGAVVKPHQVKAMVIAARLAYQVQSKLGLVDDGVGFDAWRRATLHDIVGAAAPSSFRAVTQRDYAAVMEYFAELGGHGGPINGADGGPINGGHGGPPPQPNNPNNQTTRKGDERRRALWALNLVEGEVAEAFGGRGGARKYADALFWKIHKTDRTCATARQVWAVIFTMRKRAKRGQQRARRPDLTAGTEARHPDLTTTRTRKALGARGASGGADARADASERFPAFSPASPRA